MMKRKFVKRVTTVLIAATIFAAATPPFVYAEASETPVVLEMQESYEELPPYYNAMEEGYVTGIRQQTIGNCWSYATLSSIETNLLKQGIVPDRATLDLSEDQLTAAMYTRCDDPLHNTEGDINYSKNTDGHLTWAAQILAGGLSLADEQEYLSRGEGHQFDTDFNVADFWSCAFIPTTEQDLKRAIYQYGSVSISCWSWYHGIALNGWDNAYTDSWVENSHGVFLGKDSGFVNTWEVGEYEDNWYVDYTDTEYFYEGDDMPEFWEGDQWPELFDAVAYEYREKDTYDNVYLYDGSAFSGQVEVEKAAAIFEAKAGTDDQAEQIVSATLPLASLDTTASVQIYTDLQDSGDPESGTPLFEPGSEPTIHADYSGMYSVDFREFGKTATLRQGTLFSVVMTLPKGGSVMTSCDGTYFNCYTKENIEQGQTFFLGGDYGDDWTDGLDLSHTARLHVQTKMIPISELPPPHVHSYGEDWESDNNNHWKECGCGDKTNQAVHAKAWENDTTQHWAKCDICGWEDTAKSAHVYDNDRDAACNVCGYERAVTPPVPPISGGSSYDYFTITATAGAGGSIAPSGKVSVRENGNKTFTITPNEGYVVADVLVDGQSVGAVTEYAFENITEAHTIEVSFREAGTGYASCVKDGNCPLTKFADTDLTAWYHNGIHYCVENGLMNGEGSGRFSPNAALTRGMLAQILYNKEDRPELHRSSPFDDVISGTWYANAVVWAAENKIVAGYGNGKFGPSDPITREQLAVMLWRYAGSPATSRMLDGFTDAGKTSDYAITALQWAVENRIISGKGNGILDPTGNATRAEVAAMLQRYCEKIS